MLVKCLLLSMTIAFLIRPSFELKCFECDSEINSGCLKPDHSLISECDLLFSHGLNWNRSAQFPEDEKIYMFCQTFETYTPKRHVVRSCNMNLEGSCHNFDPSTNTKYAAIEFDCDHCEYDKCNDERPHHDNANAADTVMKAHYSLLFLLVTSMLAFRAIN